MPTFLTPELLAWGLPLAALPVLIHLINLARRRRVEWAAMEFLLASQRKNSAWIRLKELLLLLLRVGIVTAIVLMLAQPLLRSELGRFLGGKRTHHIVLLDDSFSMSDRAGDSTAFDRAKSVAIQIAERAGRQTTPQDFSLILLSQGERLGASNADDAAPTDGTGSGSTAPQFLQARVDSRFGERVAEAITALTPSELSVGPLAALEAVASLWADARADDRLVYLVSDFRRKDWAEPGAMRQTLDDLTAAGVKLTFVQCVDGEHPNLAITDLKPRAGVRAAQTPMFMEVTVHNFGSETVRDVPVAIEETTAARTITIDEIAPGESETRRFPVLFTAAGKHSVTARLPLDSIAADNNRYALVDVPLRTPVLIIEGTPASPGGYILSTAFAPGGAARTGLTPQVESPTFLRDQPLEKYRSIFLVDVGRLDSGSIARLEEYVSNGGGLGIFVGPNTQAEFVNERLYRDGAGVFPMPLMSETRLIVDRLEPAPDLQVGDHPIFRIFEGERNPFLSAVRVERYWSAPQAWRPADGSTERVIAGLRNSAPLVVEKQFGKGRVVAVMTTLAPVWNNWARNPSLVVTMLEMQSYLSAAADDFENRLVGAPLVAEVDATRYQPTMRLIPPSQSKAPAVVRQATQDGLALRATFPETNYSGLYELRLAPNDATEETRMYAINVDPAEGALEIALPAELSSRLTGVPFDFHSADAYQAVARQSDESNLTEWILLALVVLLVGEQLLAYSASYHRRDLGGRA